MRRATMAMLGLCSALASAEAAHRYEVATAKAPASLSAIIAEQKSDRLTDLALGRACSNWVIRREAPTPHAPFGAWAGTPVARGALTPRQRFLGKCSQGKPVYARDLLVGYTTLPLLTADLQRCLPTQKLEGVLATAFARGAFITLDVDEVAVTGAELECLRDSASVRFIEPNCNPMYTYTPKRGFGPDRGDGLQKYCANLLADAGVTPLATLAQIGLEAGMQLERAPVRVAVLDSGVHCAHPGLWASMAHRQVGGCAVVKDSDMIDCDDVADGCPAGGDSCDAHGSEIAGAIAAQPSLSQKMMGVAQSAELLSIRVTRENPTKLASLAKAVYASADQRARVINLSWDNAFNSRALYEAIANVQSLVVAASSGDDAPYPAVWSDDLPNLIAVAATTFDGGGAPTSLLAQSKYRPGHLAAPGQCIYSTTAYRPNGALYWFNDGASSAAAYVSGAAATVFGDQRFAACSAAEMKRLLVQCAATMQKRMDRQGEFAFLNVGFLTNGLSAPQLCRDGQGLPACVGGAFR